MHVKISLALYLKHKPKTHPGLSQESWNIGDEPMTLDEQIHGVGLTLANFYRGCGVLGVEDANKAIRSAASKLIATADEMDERLDELRQKATGGASA